MVQTAYDIGLVNAIKIRDLKQAQEMIDRGAKVDAGGANTYTALIVACYNCFLPGVVFLLEHGADPVGERHGVSPLAAACAQNQGPDTLLRKPISPENDQQTIIEMLVPFYTEDDIKAQIVGLEPGTARQGLLRLLKEKMREHEDQST